MSDAELAVEIRAAAEQVATACATAERAGVPVNLAVTATEDLSSTHAVQVAVPARNAPPRSLSAAVERLNADLAEAAERRIRVRLATPPGGMVVVQEMWRAR
jgi:hypothetical protein